jgi:hypothetical protein
VLVVELYDKINYSLLKIPLHFPNLFDTTGEMLLTCAEGIADLGRSILYFVAVAVVRRSSYAWFAKNYSLANHLDIAFFGTTVDLSKTD